MKQKLTAIPERLFFKLLDNVRDNTKLLEELSIYTHSVGIYLQIKKY